MCVWNVSIEDRRCNFCNFHGCQERIITGRRAGKVMPTLANLEMNEKIELSCKHYNAIRTAIRYLRKDYEMDFKYKLLLQSIEIVRIK